MRRVSLTYLVVLLVAMSSSCSKPKAKALPREEKKAMVEIVDNPQLAKVILRSEKKPLQIIKDPFKPILSKTPTFMPGQENTQAPSESGQTEAQDVILIGVVKMEDEFRAYVKTGSKLDVYKVQDKIGPYTVLSINIDQMVLQIGDTQRVVKNRGKL